MILVNFYNPVQVYQIVAVVTPPVPNPNTTCVVEIEVMSLETTSWLSDSVQAGAVAHGTANVSVTEVKAVPTTDIWPPQS